MGIRIDFSRPGTPMDNATMESFNGRLRQECLNENWFLWRMHSAKLRPCAYTITRVVPILYWAG
ncbi:transposase [Tatumella sp. JGM82]|nr:transposase [Tatumella sp. JGM82]MBS0892289.1 transposase [Tatumella sp. JGM94]